MRTAALALALAICACGGASEGSTETPVADTSVASGGESEGNQQASARIDEGPPSGPEWRECAPERAHGMGVWIPVPTDATVELEDDACIIHPLGASDPLHAAWFVAFLFPRESASGDEALLALEPDGARRFVLEGAELTGVIELPERRVVFLGAPATVYTLRGRSDELGGEERIISATRVRLRGGIAAGIVVTRTDTPDADALHHVLELARPR